MTEAQWQKVVNRLCKYKEVEMPGGNLLILWSNGDVSLRDGSDGHCIECSTNINDIKRIYVHPERRRGNG